MPFEALKLIPGVNTELTPALLSAGIAQSQLIRHRANLPEKLGGWSKFYPLVFNSPIRDLHAWEDLNSDIHLAVGAASGLSVITDGTSQAITPLLLTTNPAVNFSTTNGSRVVNIVDAGISPTIFDTLFLQTPVAIGGIVLSGSYAVAAVTGAHAYNITAATAATATVPNAGAVRTYTTTLNSASILVTLANHGLVVGQTFNVGVSTTVGGLVVFGNYVVQTVPGANTLTINASSQASSVATVSENGGNARITYYITSGPPPLGTGYGVGPYGIGGYGTGTASSGSAGVPLTATDWTFDNWGEILLACPQGGAVYQWSADSGFASATQVYGTPIANGGLFIAMPAQILVCWGSSTSGVIDPLLVRWSDSGDYTNFIPISSDQAGSFHIPTGSRIVGGMQAPQRALIWTDVDVWAMEYIQPPFIFGFNKVATGCGALSSHCMTAVGANVYWMGLSQFYVLSAAGVVPLACDVWDRVFQNLDLANAWKIRAMPSSGFDEVGWCYPSLSGGTGEVDSYVKVNLGQQTLQWDYGSLARSAWIDQSVLGQPIGATPAGTIYQHEISPDADGAALNAWFQTGFFDLAEGEDFSVIDFVIPDFKYGYEGGTQNASLLLTIYAVDYPEQTPRVYGPFTMNAATPFLSGVRVRGRQISFRIESQDVGTWWRLGKMRFRFAPDGRHV